MLGRLVAHGQEGLEVSTAAMMKSLVCGQCTAFEISPTARAMIG